MNELKGGTLVSIFDSQGNKVTSTYLQNDDDIATISTTAIIIAGGDRGGRGGGSASHCLSVW